MHLRLLSQKVQFTRELYLYIQLFKFQSVFTIFRFYGTKQSNVAKFTYMFYGFRLNNNSILKVLI